MIDEKRLKYDLMAKTHKERFEDYKTGAKGIYYLSDDINECIDSQPKIGGWIPCSERLPETSAYMEFEPTPYMKRIEIAYMTDTVEYLIGFYDGSKWMDKHHNIIKNVIAWKPFLKLPGAYHG